MAVVGYLLGAGASAKCIPVVNKMAESIDALKERIRVSLELHAIKIMDIGLKDSIKDFANEKLDKLKKNCEDHFSIDTYAKKLFLTDKTAFNILKNDLCFFFSLMQIIEPPDKRYDNFFSSILTDVSLLPPKIKILSWNYDFQLELSYNTFFQSPDLNFVRSSLNTVSYFDCHKSNIKGFSVMKLNGSARIHDGKDQAFLFKTVTENKYRDVWELILRYKKICESSTPLPTELKFAWEKENHDKLFQLCKEELEKITVLVIIGYSFPFFNRAIDKEIFNCMPKLEKIYIQDLSPEKIEEVLLEFHDLNGYYGPINVVHKTNLDQFVFPRELDIT